MFTQEVDIATRYTKAVARMLLGRKMLKPGVALLAGGPVNIAKQLHLAHMAQDSDCDLIHLAFDDTPDGYAMTGLHVCAPRDGAVHSYSDCRLSLIGNRTVIMPARGRGHFVLEPRELIHKPAKPDGWEDGIVRAEQRLRNLVASGVDTTGQIALHAIEQE
jgi:hypothetical protein